MKLNFKIMKRKRQRGNALIETGLMAPVMFLLLSGVIDFGRAFYYTDLAASSARAGAQYGIQSPSNFSNTTGMQVAAYNDANATCQDANNATVTCGSATQSQAQVGPSLPMTVTGSSFCKDSSSGATVACTSANARGYVKVSTVITYNLFLPWPGIPNPLSIGGAAIMRTK